MTCTANLHMARIPGYSSGGDELLSTTSSHLLAATTDASFTNFIHLATAETFFIIRAIDL